MAQRHHLFLVPGFFGFANLGDLAYFGHVRAELIRALAALAVDARVQVVGVPPTASLLRRTHQPAEPGSPGRSSTACGWRWRDSWRPAPEGAGAERRT